MLNIFIVFNKCGSPVHQKYL